MDAGAKRRINDALDQIEAGNMRAGYEQLCRLIRREPGAALFPRNLHVVERPRGAVVGTPLGPPPQPRVEDSDAIKKYREEHPVCEVEAHPPELYDCWYVEIGRAEVHHLRRRSQGGDDTPDNCLSLCAAHHTGAAGFHSLGPMTWYAKLHDRLIGEARGKVRRALGLDT